MRFFMGESNAEKFDNFMKVLFTSPVTDELDQKAQNLLQTMVNDASARKIDSLVKILNDKNLSETKTRYILECLKTINSEDSKQYLKTYARRADIKGAALDYARELSGEIEEAEITHAKTKAVDIFKTLPQSFRNPLEQNAEYILIPGGSYTFEVKDKKEPVTIPNGYFAKYPVTHKRYRAFIDYLQGKNSEVGKLLQLDNYQKELEKFAEKIKGGFVEYLEKEPTELA